MIHESLLLVITLFLAMALLYVLSQRLKISYPILLVVGGLGISFIPGAPVIQLDPEIVFLIFLPPLLFEAAWYTSWNAFWRWKRSILLMGFGLVFCTSLAIAYFSVTIIPGFTLALGFLLGGIISPPDAVAATSVLKGMPIPKRGLTILEGESLVNDAASLTVFRFALATVVTGNFVLQTATSDFLELSFLGVIVGLIIAHILYFILVNFAKSSSITTPITLIAPYLMYVTAEYFQWSGVLAVVSGGLFLSFRSSDYLNYHTRIQTKEVWETIGFLLNGFVFILIGLELPIIINELGDYSEKQAVMYALSISVLVIVIRIILVYVVAYLPRLFSKRIRNSENSPGFKLPFIVGWAGMRGVVSLASAFSIPLVLSDGTPFPHRNLILFITFVVILVTLVFQGLTLPMFIKWLKVSEIDDYQPDDKQIAAIRVKLAQRSLQHLEVKYGGDLEASSVVGKIKESLEQSMNHSIEILKSGSSLEKRPAPSMYNYVMKELIAVRRAELHRLAKKKQFDSEILRKLEHNLDLEESRINRN